MPPKNALVASFSFTSSFPPDEYPESEGDVSPVEDDGEEGAEIAVVVAEGSEPTACESRR